MTLEHGTKAELKREKKRHTKPLPSSHPPYCRTAVSGVIYEREINYAYFGARQGLRHGENEVRRDRGERRHDGGINLEALPFSNVGLITKLGTKIKQGSLLLAVKLLAGSEAGEQIVCSEQ